MASSTTIKSIAITQVTEQKNKQNKDTQHNGVALRTLKIQDLDKVIKCSKYYGRNETEWAINETKQWYIEQEFDDDDFTNDWIPNDYNNCDGIQIFMQKILTLYYSKNMVALWNAPMPINSESNKQILFNWFCYWLYPGLSPPDKEPTSNSIYDNIPCEIPSNCKHFTLCKSIRRLLGALHNYTTLTLQSVQDDEEKFVNFANEVYKHQAMIQDFTHFQKYHDHQLFEIINYLLENEICPKCDIETCGYATRHYRLGNDKLINNDVDPYLLLYKDTLDSFHCYLWHLYDVGLRCIRQKEEKQMQDTDVNNGTLLESSDPEFGRISDIVSSTRGSSNRLDRISSRNKFNIEMTQVAPSKKMTDDAYDATYLDGVFRHLYESGVLNEMILKLMRYLKREQYDTESMDWDLHLSAHGGNIFRNLCNKECAKLLEDIFKTSRGMFMQHFLIYDMQSFVICFSFFRYFQRRN